jgi:UTP--glucose-1-phosphate uridylyltransferase
LGTRFLPATKAQPKEMLPLVDKPIIQYAVEEAVSSGLENLVIVTGRGKNAIEDHFDVSYELEKILEARGESERLSLVRAVSDMVQLAYVRQKEALGLGHAILMTRDLVNEEAFAVLLGDDVILADPPCIGQMIRVFEQSRASVIAIMEVPPDQAGRYGIIRASALPGNDGRLFEVHDLVEKPSPDRAPSNLAIIGRYILRVPRTDAPGKRRGDTADRRPAPPARPGADRCLPVQGEALRRGHQARFPAGDRRVRPAQSRARRRFP